MQPEVAKTPVAPSLLKWLRQRQRLIMQGVVTLGWIILFASTLGLREANLDDVNFQRIVNEGKVTQYMAEWGPAQGRYYGPFVFAPIWALDSLHNSWLFQLARLGLVATSLILLARFIRRLGGSPDLTYLWLLLWIGCIQIPPTFYGLLSYPQLSCGLIFVLWAALYFIDESENPEKQISWKSGFLFFIALQFNEAFLAFGALFFALWLRQHYGGKKRASPRMLIQIGAAAVLYLAIYGSYRFIHRHQIAYEGVAAGTSLRGILTYITRYTASSLPGFELVIDRNPSHSPVRPLHDIEMLVVSADHRFWLGLWAVIVGSATAWCLATLQWRRSLREAAWLSVLFGASGLLFLAVPSVSAKYQTFAYFRSYPHAYNFIWVHFMWASVVFIVAGFLVTHCATPTKRALFSATIGIAVGAICLSTQISNQITIQEIRETVNTALALPRPK